MSSMWTFLSNIWGEVADSAIGQATGSLYNTVSGYAGDAYDLVTGYTGQDQSPYNPEFYGHNFSSTLGTALEFGKGFLDIAAAESKGMPKSSRRRVSAPNSTAGSAQFKAGKSNMASLEFGYTPRVSDAIVKANASKVPSIEMAIAQMMNYKGSGGATIKLQGAKPPSVAARTKLPSFAPKYYG